MGSRYILDINSNDELHSVIKKCNSNFKAIVGQLELQTKNDKRTRDQDKQDTSDAIDDAVSDATEEWNQELGDAVDDLVDAIGTVDDKFDNYTKTEDLAAVALSGDYDDLSNAPILASVATSGDYNDLLNKPAAQTTVIDTGTDNFSASSGFTKMGFRGHRYGNVITVTVQVSTQNQLTPGNDYNIGNVLAAWRPLEYTGGSGLLCVADFSSAGVIRIQPIATIPANTGIRVHFSFIVQ